MKLLARYRLFRQMEGLLTLQRLLIEAKDAEIALMELQHARDVLKAERQFLDLVIAFRREMDEPDPGLAEKLEGMICDVADHVARLEEQIV